MRGKTLTGSIALAILVAVSGPANAGPRQQTRNAGATTAVNVDATRLVEEKGTSARSIDVTSDLKKAVIGGKDGRVRVIEIDTGRELVVLEGHAAEVTSVRIFGANKRVVTGSLDKSVRIWNLETGQQIKIHQKHTGAVTSVDVSDDGMIVVSGSVDKTVRVWKTGSDTVTPFEKHLAAVTAVAVSANGTRAVSADSNKIIVVWTPAQVDASVISEITGHSGAIRSLAMSDDGTRVVSGGADKIVGTWNATTGAQIAKFTTADPIVAVAVTADGKRAVHASATKVAVFEVATGKALTNLKTVKPVFCTVIAKNGRCVLTGGDLEVKTADVKGTVRVFNFK